MTDKRCDLGSLAARWGVGDMRPGLRPETRDCPRQRAEGERQDGDHPVPRVILRRHGLAGNRRAEGCGGGPGAPARVRGRVERGTGPQATGVRRGQVGRGRAARTPERATGG